MLRVRRGAVIDHALIILWLLALYGATTVQFLLRTDLPQWQLELRQIVLHLAAYGVGGWLMARAWHGLPGAGRRHWLLLVVVMAALVGLGQEVLQSLLRGMVRAGPSLFDLAVDALGAFSAVMVFNRVRSRRARLSD